MKITLPPRDKSEEHGPELETKCLVVVGANGAGKTRFGSWIEKNCENVHRISAQKSLVMPESVSTTSLDIAEKDWQYGRHDGNDHWLKGEGRETSRWQGNVNTSTLNDYTQLMILLHTKEYSDALKYMDSGGEKQSETVLLRIKQIWERVLRQRKLERGAGIIEVYPAGQKDNKYNGSEMSDGERVIFYLIGSVLCVPKNSIVIIDEPELHLHPSLVNSLFDSIEAERQDCSIIYLTHNVDFATSRRNDTKIWVKSYNGGVWEYDFLEEKTPIPEDLYLAILGARKPVIFVEGTKTSVDYELYEQVFPETTIMPAGGCKEVIHLVRSFNKRKEFHRIESHGIIDRDCRDESEINSLVSKGDIWVLDVAEVENFYLLEEIVKAVAFNEKKNPETVFNIVKKNTRELFSKEISKQELIHLREALGREYRELKNFESEKMEEIFAEIDQKYKGISKKRISERIDRKFKKILDNNDHNGILRVFNHKGLISDSGVCGEIGVHGPAKYRELVIEQMKMNTKLGKKIRKAIEEKIVKQPINQK